MTVTRFAPSPTGPLHLGHAYSAVTAHRLARDAGGAFRLRIDDLDPGRSREQHIAPIYDDLSWLGLTPDGAVMRESERLAVYDDALDTLKARGLAYPCFCTRADIAAALGAPHGDTPHYPGTCRGLPDDPARREASPHSWRLDSGRALKLAALPTWHEAGGREYRATTADIDDVILARKDAPASYHLACVLDDAAQGVTMVVRGEDLRSSTPIQRLLQDLLGLGAPTYCHHRTVGHEDGRRLAKRDRAPTLAAMRADGVDGPALAAALEKDMLPLGFAFVTT